MTLLPSSRVVRSSQIVVMMVLGWLISPSPAAAKIRFCNQTQGVIEAALGYRQKNEDGDLWISEGWWRIEPSQCSPVYGELLNQRFFYYYAVALNSSKAGKPPLVWQGKYQFCTDSKAFRIEGDGDCEGRGFRPKRFIEVDLGSSTKDYTLDFKDGG